MTELQQKHVHDLYHVIKEKHHTPHIKDLHKIVNDMVHSVHHDDRVNHIYNKQHTIEQALHTMFVHGNDTHHHSILQSYQPVIHEKLEQEKKRGKSHRSSCVTM